MLLPFRVRAGAVPKASSSQGVLFRAGGAAKAFSSQGVQFRGSVLRWVVSISRALGCVIPAEPIARGLKNVSRGLILQVYALYLLKVLRLSFCFWVVIYEEM